MAETEEPFGGISGPARLLRGFTVDFLNSHDAAAAREIMDPAYQLTIGGHVFSGRDDGYLPAALAQLEQFPGLCVTVHDVLLAPDAVAMLFTEHGVSRRNSGRAAAWGGIALFRIDRGRLRYGWADEDYFACKRQLATGVCDAVRAPHPCPWDTVVVSADESTATTARAWLADPTALASSGIVEQICAGGPALADLIAIEAVDVDVLVSAGPRVAFRAIVRGRYAGGFADVAASRHGAPVALSVTGLLTVTQGQVAGVQIAFDRLSLQRSLSDRR